MFIVAFATHNLDTFLGWKVLQTVCKITLSEAFYYNSKYVQLFWQEKRIRDPQIWYSYSNQTLSVDTYIDFL